MNRLVCAMLTAVTMTFGSCAQNKTDTEMNKENINAAVVYFSNTGTTEAVAKNIAEVTGAELYRIEPEQPYTPADLDWQDDSSRTTKEMNDRASRPAIKNGKINLDGIDTVYLGYPIWWDQAPRVINTFIEANDLSGKKIITFCTSGETSIDGSVRQLRSDYPTLDIVKGKRLNGASARDVEKWISSIQHEIDNH